MEFGSSETMTMKNQKRCLGEDVFRLLNLTRDLKKGEEELAEEKENHHPGDRLGKQCQTRRERLAS